MPNGPSSLDMTNKLLGPFLTSFKFHILFVVLSIDILIYYFRAPQSQQLF